MPEELPQTAPRPLEKCFLLLLLLTAGAYAARPLMSYDDFWQHAAVGRWILEHHQIPRETLFLWTAKQPWVAHSWGTQLWFALFMSAGETVGPLLGRIFAGLMVAATFGILWRLWARQGRVGVLASAAFALAIAAVHWRFEARPELFTALFLALLLSFLVRRRAEETRTMFGPREIAVVALFVLWANMHGAFAVGLVMLALTALGDAAQDRLDRRARGLFLLLGACAAATLINPYGAQLWAALRQINSHTFAFLDEWKPPLANPPLGWAILAPLSILTLAAVGAWVLSPQRRWAHLLWTAFWIYSFCAARRHAWMLAITCLVVLAANQDVWRKIRVAPRTLNLARGAILLALLATLAGDALPGLSARSDVPTKLCDVLDQYNPPGRMFNGFISAAYLAWRSEGRRELFIDHLQAHPDALIDDYNDITNATPRGQKLLDEMKIGYVILRNPGDARYLPRLGKHLHNSPDWELVFFDEDALMWVRKTPEYAAIRAAKNQYVPAELR